MHCLWTRLEDKIRTLGAKGEFGPPAQETSMLTAESVLGVRLPEDLRSWLEIHNGDALKKIGIEGWQSDGPFADIEWLSTGGILSEWETWQNSSPRPGFEPIAEGPVKPLWWSPLWIPFTVIGGSAWHHCIDLDPAEGGMSGQVIEIVDDESWRRVVAPSFRAFLGQILCDLSEARYAIDEDGRLMSVAG